MGDYGKLMNLCKMKKNVNTSSLMRNSHESGRQNNYPEQIFFSFSPPGKIKIDQTGPDVPRCREKQL
jgi:hypothetical protein